MCQKIPKNPKLQVFLRQVLLPSKGRGLVLSRSVQAGELLLVSKALFLAPAEQIQRLRRYGMVIRYSQYGGGFQLVMGVPNSWLDG